MRSNLRMYGRMRLDPRLLLCRGIEERNVEGEDEWEDPREWPRGGEPYAETRGFDDMLDER